MICPNCQTVCGDADHYCYLCGAPLQQPKSRKGSRWVPLLLLILMSVVGIIIFFATAGNHAPIRAQGSMPWFYVQNGVLYFEAHRYHGGGELTVPSEVAGQTVYALGEDCFADCTQLTAVNLPDTLASIGDGAFCGCTSLRGIAIPDSVNVIGEKAFYGCSALEAVSISGHVRDIREDAFDECSYLGYIFYGGLHDEWMSLYDEFINPYVGVICQDGSFYQGGELYE